MPPTNCDDHTRDHDCGDQVTEHGAQQVDRDADRERDRDHAGDETKPRALRRHERLSGQKTDALASRSRPP